MQQLECESNSITCMSCLYVHVYGNKVIYLSIIRSNFFKNDHIREFPEPPHVEITMDQFIHRPPTTTNDVQSIILKSTNASCDLDPFPTRLLKHYIADLIVPISLLSLTYQCERELFHLIL